MNTAMPHRRGVTLPEVLIAAGCIVAMLAFTAPVVEITSCDSALQRSINNLRILGKAHAAYAADWNDRQFTTVRDDLAVFGDCCDYPGHPPVVLGESCEGDVFQFAFDGGSCGGNCAVVQPLVFSGFAAGFGAFRLPNARGFHEYVNGKFYDPVFYAPRDPVFGELQTLGVFHEDCEYVDIPGGDFVFSATYVNSPAALFHPDVLRQPVNGGYQDPFSFDQGFLSPTVSQALYPDLKTRMVEHVWLQDRGPADEFNPCFAEPTPYYFNHGFTSRPMSLFFDGHVNGLSVQQAERNDEQVRNQSDLQLSLWNRDTPLGADGYFGVCGFDFSRTSFHILTTEGIRGRDRLADP